jgi:hypothetical protein
MPVSCDDAILLLYDSNVSTRADALAGKVGKAAAAASVAAKTRRQHQNAARDGPSFQQFEAPFKRNDAMVRYFA